MLVKCDIETVVSVPKSGRTTDPFLGACTHKCPGKNNKTADLLSRWVGSNYNFQELHTFCTISFVGPKLAISNNNKRVLHFISCLAAS